MEFLMSASGKPRAHLVLSGGGVLCLSYAGALRVLEERGIEFKSVTTCSAGTFIGALRCAGLKAEDLEGEIQRLSVKALKGERAWPWELLRWPFAWLRKPGFPEVFRQILGGRDPTLGELEPPLATVGIDIAFRRLLAYSSNKHPDMRVSEALDIAVSIPGVYPPHELNGRIVLDAGIATECPVWAVEDDDDFRLPIIALRPAKSAKFEHPKSLLAYVGEAFSSAVRSRDDYVIKQMPRVLLVEIDCGEVRGNQFDLSASQKRNLIAAGREAAERALSVFGDDLSNVRQVTREPAPGSPSREGVAQDSADNKMKRFQETLSNEVRNRVFISYSHKDERWMVLVKKHLKPYALIVWSDQQISPGEEWRDAIKRELAASKVAVLLVTPDFLDSDFIMKQEFPSIAEAAKRGRLKVLWLHVRPSAWRETCLEPHQAAYNTDRPLAKLEPAARDEALVEVGKRVKEALRAA